MANYTYAQLEAIWNQAAAGTKYTGTSPVGVSWAALMAAIALAESGGNPSATNPTDNGGTQTSWGLWQISLGNHNAPSATWNNPITNAQLAIGKLNSQGLGAWGTYTSGAYKAHLNGSTTPAPNIPSIPGAAASDTATATLTAAETQSQAAAVADCALGYDQHVGVFFGHGPTISFCLISKSQVRGFMGGLLLVGGAGIMLSGVVLLAAAGFSHTGAGRVVVQLGELTGVGKIAGRAARVA